jgi:prepilin-type N-terminal cleavage/methylation domain-containing protein
MKRTRTAFTLIELLIVVAIIAILAAIAVPNFLEAQIRSKVSRVKADQRSLATALETYVVDHNHYPPNKSNPRYQLSDVFFLTTPISYITNVGIKDPFAPGFEVSNNLDSFQYFNFESSPADGAFRSWGSYFDNDSVPRLSCCLASWGPNAGKTEITVPPGTHGNDGGEWYGAFGPGLPPSSTGVSTLGIDRVYDPTNGTISAGDILRVAGATGGWELVP